MLHIRKIITSMAASLIGALLLTGCIDTGGSTANSSPAFRILAGSELKDVAEEVTAFGKSKGVNVQFEYSGSLDAIDKLGETHNFDAVWVSHGKYLHLVPGVKSQIKASEKTMYSRVVMGVKPEKAKELGWDLAKDSDISWKSVIAAVKAGKLHLAMTNPAGSNTGFVTLVGVASELSGKGDALTEADIPTAQLKDLFSGITLTSGSSGDLMDKFKADPTKADAVINYESAIRATNLLVAIPKEGVITADYPLMLLKNSTQQPFYDELIVYLRDPATQKTLAAKTLRTPLSGDGSDKVINELPFPASLNVVDTLLSGFLNEYAKPASSYFVLDVSGSMNGDRLKSAKQAMTSLATSDGSVSGRFSTFRNRERISLTAFSDVVYPAQEFSLGQNTADNQKVLTSIENQVNALNANGGTAIYSGVLSVYDKARAEVKAGGRSVSIVLLTDGDNNNGASLSDFTAHVNAVGAPIIPVFGILYGEANTKDMNQLTALTGGRVFDARKTSLKSVLKAIRNYQ